MNNYPIPTSQNKYLTWPDMIGSKLPVPDLADIKRQMPVPFPLKNGIGNSFVLSTTPQQVLVAHHDQIVLVTNTAQQVGTGTGIAVTTVVQSGILGAVSTTQANALDVSQYETVHAFLNITAITGTWDLYQQTYDPVVDAWVDVAIIPEFTGMTAIADSGYALLGPAGIAELLAFKFNPTAAGNITCTLGVMVKSGIGPAIVNIPGIAYLGDRNVNATSGFPIFPGDFRLLQIASGTDLWAMSDTGITIKTFLF